MNVYLLALVDEKKAFAPTPTESVIGAKARVTTLVRTGFTANTSRYLLIPGQLSVATGN